MFYRNIRNTLALLVLVTIAFVSGEVVVAQDKNEIIPSSLRLATTMNQESQQQVQHQQQGRRQLFDLWSSFLFFCK